MFLAFKEIKHEKLRYGLIGLMIFLIGYLIFMLSSLAIGLADQNTEAIYSWNLKKVVLNENTNINLGQSLLTKKDLHQLQLTNKEAELGQAGVVVKRHNRPTVSAQFIALKPTQYIYKNQDLVAGRKAKKADEVTADVALKNQGYRLGDQVKLNGNKQKVKIVGFVDQAKINVAPILYGSFSKWKKLKVIAPNVVCSGIVSQNSDFSWHHGDAKTYAASRFINKLPGYTAQNATFEMMIAFLFVISLIVIAVFLYILTMQKRHNFAVMRAQGIPSKTIVLATISQAVILVVSATVVSLLAMLLSAKFIPDTMPFTFTPAIAAAGSLGLLLMGIIGSLIPIKAILKVDPATAIGG